MKSSRFVDDGDGIVLNPPNGKAAMIRLAASLPKGSAERRALLASLQGKAAHPLDKVRKHQLLPKSVAATLPKLYEQEKVKDPIVWVKLFSPYMNKGVWYITEYNPGDRTAFGWVDLGMGGGELGYINIGELEGLSKRGLPLVERDLYWRPKPLSEAKRG